MLRERRRHPAQDEEDLFWCDGNCDDMPAAAYTNEYADEPGPAGNAGGGPGREARSPDQHARELYDLQTDRAIAVVDVALDFGREFGLDILAIVSGSLGSLVSKVDKAMDGSRAIAAGNTLRFGQASVRSTFAHGPHAGRTIAEVARGLRSGKISPDTLPVEFIFRNGGRVALNNRSLTALRRAGMQPTKLIDRTGIPSFEKWLDLHLAGGTPSDFIRIRGGPPGTSLIE